MKRRKLTPFLAHEMLYDYATGQLDDDRKRAIEEFLPTDRESQVLLASIQAAIEYSRLLGGSKVDDEILTHLKEAESALSLGKKYSSWSEWPESLRWSLTALGLSALVAAIVAVVPWSRFNTKAPNTAGPQTVEIAQIPQPSSDELEAANAVAENEGSGDEPPDDAGDEGSGDEHEEGGEAVAAAPSAKAVAPLAQATPAPKITPASTASAASPVLAAASPELEKTPEESPEGTVTHITPYFLSRSLDRQIVIVSLRFIPDYIVPPQRAKALPPTQVAAAAPAPKPAMVVAKTSPTPSLPPQAVNELADGTSETASPSDAKAKGFVYRAFMTLGDLDEIGPKITDDLLSLGAEKAGEVELGWKRGSGRYYHFSLPAENEQKILEKLQVYGPVRISKDPHPRVMPKGEVRFILWVESAN